MVIDCPHPQETEHGYKTVEVLTHPLSRKSYCEAGLGCLEKCPHAFKAEDEAEATEAFKHAFPIPQDGDQN